MSNEKRGVPVDFFRAAVNQSDIASAPNAISNEVIRLREWGTDRAHMLPQPSSVPDRFGDAPPDGVVGSAKGCEVRLIDPRVSPRHAQLAYHRQQWWIRDLGSAAGLREDGAPRAEFALVPGAEISVGPKTLIAESRRSIVLRNFCTRMLGFGSDCMPAVDRALRAIRLALAYRSPLILRGERDLVPIGYALHRHTLGVDAPFVVCDPRRRTVETSVRSLANDESGVAAFRAASGGSLCMRRDRLPIDFTALLARLHEPDPRVQLIVCSERDDRGVHLAGPVPIFVPPLRGRASELPRIVEAYVVEAIAALDPVRAQDSSFITGQDSCFFTGDDLQWVVECMATSLPEIEKATLRIVALRMSRSAGQSPGSSANLRVAAERLGMAPVSLTRWFERRRTRKRPTTMDKKGRLARC
jgi:hypothetical protein